MKTIFLTIVFLLVAGTLVADDKPASGYIKQGRAQLLAGNFQRAVKTFETAARINPNSAEAYEGIGEAYLGLGKNPVSTDPELVEKGVSNLRTALKLNPGSAQARYKLALGYLALYDKDSASREFQLLKSMDKGLANDLAARIREYKAPEKYSLIGSSGESGRNRSGDSARKGKSVTQPKEGRFTGTVELFVVNWCPSCKQAIAYLRQKNIPYKAYDVEVDAVAKKRFDDLGGRGYPLILVGSKQFYGSDPKTIDYYVGR